MHRLRMIVLCLVCVLVSNQALAGKKKKYHPVLRTVMETKKTATQDRKLLQDDSGGGGYDSGGGTDTSGGTYDSGGGTDTSGGTYDSGGGTDTSGGTYDSGGGTDTSGGTYDSGGGTDTSGGTYDSGGGVDYLPPGSNPADGMYYPPVDESGLNGGGSYYEDNPWAFPNGDPYGNGYAGGYVDDTSYYYGDEYYAPGYDIGYYGWNDGSILVGGYPLINPWYPYYTYPIASIVINTGGGEGNSGGSRGKSGGSSQSVSAKDANVVINRYNGLVSVLQKMNGARQVCAAVNKPSRITDSQAAIIRTNATRIKGELQKNQLLSGDSKAYVLNLLTQAEATQNNEGCMNVSLALDNFKQGNATSIPLNSASARSAACPSYGNPGTVALAAVAVSLAYQHGGDLLGSASHVAKKIVGVKPAIRAIKGVPEVVKSVAAKINSYVSCLSKAKSSSQPADTCPVLDHDPEVRQLADPRRIHGSFRENPNATWGGKKSSAIVARAN